MSQTAAGERAFRYHAIGRDGRAVSDVVQAADERAALSRLAAEGLTVTRLDPAAAARRGLARRELKLSERVLLMRQLALMLEAGVPLLEAIGMITSGVQAERGRAQLEAVSAALKRGDSLGHALAAHAPGFPPYVYAMANIGEASGRTAEVLRDAAEQMAYEDRLRRDFANALTYPGFLAVAGLAALGFIFVEVVPRFSAMIGQRNTHMPAMSRAVLAIGDFASSHLVLVAGGLLLLVAALLAVVGTPAARRGLYRFGLTLPLAGRVLRAREIAAWARLTGFGLANGLDLLSAVALSREAVQDPALKRGLQAFDTDLKAGVAIDASLGANTPLRPMDLSLLRAGQRSGALARMFGFLAEGYEAELKDAVKRLTAVIEPLAIGVISIIVGVVALSLVMALSSVYETIG
jgi:general secretion pathway protein F